MNHILEIILGLDRDHNVPMDIIREIISEWICYKPIENNEKFREWLRVWFNKKEENQKERNNKIFKYGHISDWDTKNITDMNRSFYDKTEFNEDISRWNVSNVIDMSYMFCLSLKFECNLSLWNVSIVTDMTGMFCYCEKFNCDISRWDVSKVICIKNMFYKCILFNCDVSNWNIQNVEDFEGSFIGCNHLSYLTQINKLWSNKNNKFSKLLI